VTKIQIFNAAGTLIAEVETKPYEVGKRISVWAANAQRKLDALIAANPDAVTGKIGTQGFVVRNGRSSSVGL
jgi:adenylosuccinate lyase